MKNSRFLSSWREEIVCQLHCKRESTTIGKQQFVALTIYTLTMILGMGGCLFGISGPQGSIALVLNSVYVGCAILTYVVYLANRLRITYAFAIIVFLTQLFTSVEMIICALNPSQYTLMLIVANTVILSVNILFSLIAYLKYVPPILALVSVAVYWVCTLLTNDDSLTNFGIIFSLIFINIAVLSNRMLKNINSIKQENEDLLDEEEQLLNVLKLKRSGVKAFVALARQRNEYEDTVRYLDILDAESHRNLIENVKEYIAKRELSKLSMKNVFPELTPSEIEIVELIVQDKKLTEICLVLNKKESNISAQRTNIRKKLGLNPQDNLHEVLLQRIAAKR